MRVPAVSTSSERLLKRFGEFHLVALRANKKTKSLAGDFALAQRNLETLYQKRLALESTLTESEALAATSEAEAEEALSEVEIQCLALVKRKRKQEPYATAFPNGLTGALKPRGREQITEIERVMTFLTNASDVNDNVLGLLPALLHATDAMRSPIHASEAADKALTATLLDEQSAKRAWRVQYRKDHGLLTAMFPAEKRLVESFFRRIR